MKKRSIFLALLLGGIFISTKAQTTLSLDSCRRLALAGNKSLRISQEKIGKMTEERKAAFTNYLPNISLSAGYVRNGKELSILSDEKKNALSSVGTNMAPAIGQVAQQIATQFPELAPLISSLGSSAVPTLNEAGQKIVDAFRTDNRNMFGGMLTLIQPIYMGGKIRAYNKITHYAEELAREQESTQTQEIILQTDQAYWQVVSLANKKKLAESYLKLLQQLSSDVEKMVNQGVATKADLLTVNVKTNEAEMTLTKVDNGLSLSKMLLCQICGIEINNNISLTDESLESLPLGIVSSKFNINEAYASRPELKSLQIAANIYDEKVKVARAAFLPSATFVGNILVSNPNVFNGFENKFNGTWNVGVALQVPIWHWGESTHKIRSAKADARIARLELAEAQEKIELQINQSAFKVDEAQKKLIMSNKNMEKANENLRYANIGFKEGVIPTNNLLEAQTAWLQAQSEKIDSQIDVKLTETCLKKAIGSLNL